MRICQVTGEFYDTEAGGIGTYVYNLSRKLVERGHEVDVIAYELGKPQYKPVEGLNVCRVPLGRLPVLKNITWGRRVKMFLKKHRKNYDVFHSHMRTAMSYPLFHDVDVPMVVTFHSMYDEKLKSADIGSKFLETLRGYEDRIAASKAKRIISIGYNTEGYAGNYCEKTTIIPNSVVVEEFREFYAKKPQLKKKLGLEGKKVALFVGRLEPHKGVDYLIDALNYVENPEDLMLIIVGSGSLLETLKNKTRKNSKIVIKGPLYGDALKEMYAASDILVIPSLYEGLPTVLLEGMASGLGVIASDIPSIRPVVNEDFCLLVKPKNSREIAKAIESLIHDERKLSKMGRFALMCSKKFDWSKSVLRVEKVYKEVQETG